MMGAGVAAIVLAAGASSRMAPRHKLLLRGADGATMVGRAVSACCKSGVGDVLVVTGHASAAVEQAAREAVPGDRMTFVRADDHALGLAASLSAGIAALPHHADAALICLADMPLVTAIIIDRLLAAYDPAVGRLIIVPTAGGQRGNPVLWDRRFFAAMAALSGDTGARVLLAEHAAMVTEIDVGDAAVLHDFDTPDSLLAGF